MKKALKRAQDELFLTEEERAANAEKEAKTDQAALEAALAEAAAAKSPKVKSPRRRLDIKALGRKVVDAVQLTKNLRGKHCSLNSDLCKLEKL